ncbi:hypothetical protein Ahy_A01g000438 [Arachis hypogaea]|uniref:Ubiquitin-like protease family profile domain-containing protein n=1 Tax=Arachis hypogaea TaxID=3818 RepID=A0A445EKE6_ARAHY|nr:hypothetical protein Ahy_A01g000438 [Arachis hypogaea]
MADVRKKKFCILDPYNKKCLAPSRMKFNTFVGYVISRMSFDCAIYVMKCLEIIEPENIKRGRYDWDNWTQAEVDHFRVEYASQILFDEINSDRDIAIRKSEAIRLSKPSATLLSPYCQIDSNNFDTD